MGVISVLGVCFLERLTPALRRSLIAVLIAAIIKFSIRYYRRKNPYFYQHHY